MAITTNTGAKKIEGTDNWREIFDIHNDTVDAYDESIENIQDGLAIVASGNVHAAIGINQFVYVKNHDTLADGLYKNTSGSTINANATLSSSNLTADASGGLNSLSEAIANVQDGLAIVANGNTHAAIGAGQFVYVKNHGTLADGLYTNTSGSTIAANATLSSSNLTADASGGLNSLNSKIKILYTKTYTVSFESYGAGTIGTRAAQKSVDLSSDISAYGSVVSVFFSGIDNSSAAHYQTFMNSSTLYVNAYRAVSDATSAYSVRVTVTFAKQA